MQAAPAASTSFQTLTDHIEQALDGVVDHGTSDELFLSSYLQGHFAVIARQLEMQADASSSMLDDAMQESLNSAFANNELEDADQNAVFALWQKLLNDARQA